MKRKTRIERVYNEDTGWFETREVELNSYSFTDDDRIMIVREYMESGLPAEEIIKKYYISSFHGFGEPDMAVNTATGIPAAVRLVAVVYLHSNDIITPFL